MRIIPTLYGSSKADLLEPRKEAIQALQQAERALAKATPQRHDYATPVAHKADRGHVKAQRTTILTLIDALVEDGLDIMSEFES